MRIFMVMVAMLWLAVPLMGGGAAELGKEIDSYLARAQREITALSPQDGKNCLSMIVASYADARQIERAQRIIDQAPQDERSGLQRALVMSLALSDASAATRLADSISDVSARDSAYRFVALHVAQSDLAAARQLMMRVSEGNRLAAWRELAGRVLSEGNLEGAQVLLGQIPAGADHDGLVRQVQLAQWLEGPISELSAKSKQAGVDLAALSPELRSAAGRLAAQGQLDKAKALALFISNPFHRGLAWASIALAQARGKDQGGYAKSIQLARDCVPLADDAFRPLLDATILRTDSEFGDVEEVLRQIKRIQADPDDLRQALIPQMMVQLCLRRGAYDSIIDLCVQDKTPLRSLFIQNIAQTLAERGQTATIERLLARLTGPEDRAHACLGAAMGLISKSRAN